MESDLRQEETPAAPARPVEVESGMRTGQGDYDADEEMTIGDKFDDADPESERTDPEAVAEAAKALGADAADENAAATAPAAQI